MEALNQNQENKLSMYEGVLTVLNDNSTIVTSLPAMGPKLTELTGIVASIKTKGSEKRDATKGRAQTKSDAEDAMVRITVEVASMLYAYSRTVKDNETMEICNVTDRGMRKMRDTEKVSRATSILQKAQANIAGLGGYGITSTTLGDLEAKINAFNTAMGARESGAAVRSGAVKSLSELFKQADDALYEDMDMMVEGLKSKYPDFYNTYWAARVIKDLGIRHEAAAATTSTTTTPTT